MVMVMESWNPSEHDGIVVSARRGWDQREILTWAIILPGIETEGSINLIYFSPKEESGQPKI
jgi:hypothetical protein